MIEAKIIKRTDSLAKLPLTTLLRKEQAAEAAVKRQFGKKSPQVEATKRLTIFAEKMKFTEFFSGKGKPESKAKKFFTENFANPPEKRLQFFFGYGIVYKLLMQTEV